MDIKQKLVEVSRGVYVEEDALRIVEKIKEYDPNLNVKYCAHPDSLTDAPYILVETCPDGNERIVFNIWELDDRVIERLYQADTKRVDIQGNIDLANIAAKKEEDRRYKELQDEATEIAASVIKSPKETFKFVDPFTKKGVKIHQHRPVEVEKGEG